FRSSRRAATFAAHASHCPPILRGLGHHRSTSQKLDRRANRPCRSRSLAPTRYETFIFPHITDETKCASGRKAALRLLAGLSSFGEQRELELGLLEELQLRGRIVGGEPTHSTFTGIKGLMLAVLEDGLRSFLSSKDRVREEAEAWMRMPSAAWPFSFVAVC